MAIVTRLLAPAALLVALAMPAAAQQSEEGTPMTAAECRSLFQEADTNGDGVLSQQEMAAADLEGFQAGIGLSAFLSECQG
jgi:Ca2+-binding EF-hand superfamily protein